MILSEMEMKKKICKRRFGIDRKSQNVSELQYCENHFKINIGIEKEKKDVPPDEQRCCVSSGPLWRCKNARLWVDAAEDDDNTNVPNTKFCRHHYTYYAEREEKRKKKICEAKGSDAGCTTNCSNNPRKKKTVVAEDDRSIDETGTQLPASTTTTSDKSESGKLADVGTRMNTVKDVIERALANATECLTRNRDPVVELDSLEHYKDECVKLAVELEKKKVECATLEGKLVELDTRMAAVTDESKQALANATECWTKMLSDLESRLLRMEKEKSTIGCPESRILNLENMVLRMDNENSTMAGSVQSRISKLERLNLRIEDENLTRAGCVESRLLNLESLVQENKKPFVNVVSDDGGESSGERFKKDSDNSVDPNSSLGDLVYKLAMNNWNRSRSTEIKWVSEADMLSSFEEDPELCMKAVCALYRQHLSDDQMSAKGFFHYRDMVRVTTLSQFLMDEDRKGDLKRSVEELEIFDSEAVENCKMLARSYSKHLFDIYQNRKDPYFLPTITASPGDQTA